jgi:hypothetical protein
MINEDNNPLQIGQKSSELEGPQWPNNIATYKNR